MNRDSKSNQALHWIRKRSRQQNPLPVLDTPDTQTRSDNQYPRRKHPGTSFSSFSASSSRPTWPETHQAAATSTGEPRRPAVGRSPQEATAPCWPLLPSKSSTSFASSSALCCAMSVCERRKAMVASSCAALLHHDDWSEERNPGARANHALQSPPAAPRASDNNRSDRIPGRGGFCSRRTSYPSYTAPLPSAPPPQAPAGCALVEGRRQLHGNRHFHVTVPCRELAVPSAAMQRRVHPTWPATKVSLKKHACAVALE